jgi:hypothetical protein
MVNFERRGSAAFLALVIVTGQRRLAVAVPGAAARRVVAPTGAEALICPAGLKPPSAV